MDWCQNLHGEPESKVVLNSAMRLSLQRLLESSHQIALHVHIDLSGHLSMKRIITISFQSDAMTKLTASRLRRSCSCFLSSARLAADLSRVCGVVGVAGEGLPCGDALISSTTRVGIGSAATFLKLLNGKKK